MAESYFWFVKTSREIAGNVTLQNINKMMLTAEVGYEVITTARGKRVATLVVHTLAKNIFEQTKLRKLIAYVHEENRASRRCFEGALSCEWQTR